MMELKGAALTAVAGLRLCLVAYGLPDSGGPAEPTEETADWAECHRPRAQIQASCCSWILLHRRLAIKMKYNVYLKEQFTKRTMNFINNVSLGCLETFIWVIFTVTSQSLSSEQVHLHIAHQQRYGIAGCIPIWLSTYWVMWHVLMSLIVLS